MIAAVAALLLLPSGSSSMLCIAPGGHVAIEDLNAPCCESSHISSPAKEQPHDGFTAAGDCRNCVDLFVTANECGTRMESFHNNSAHDFDGECCKNLFLAVTPIGLSPLIVFRGVDVPAPVSFSVPLRC